MDTCFLVLNAKWNHVLMVTISIITIIIIIIIINGTMF